jgi:hypothetical protein
VSNASSTDRAEEIPVGLIFDPSSLKNPGAGITDVKVATWDEHSVGGPHHANAAGWVSWTIMHRSRIILFRITEKIINNVQIS